eukprot:gnl/MRDRNA2_/MRDRNA2_89173_c0_seq1.p1 gnl/MRDRNA2_/MRDRNA2_89173_c0~~gnl/MRDRNA2_/MRDRNA2_89173_c0_seq1.p1  ORF type:complete len:351 (+),score=86.25 gnl/MRDRNA2_/MRDRNA2_89173_c0_seq1:77-1129(+)
MPGLLETTIQSGYGYLDPYVEKARTTVPLLDRVAKHAEVHVPPLISRADEFAHPRIEKVRPYIEPKIEQVKEVVTPYVDHGVKHYEMVQDKVEKAKVHGRGKIEKLRSFHEDQVQKVKTYKDHKVGKVQTLLTKKGGEINKMFRVPSTDDVAGLKHKQVLSKMALIIRKAEEVVDKWLPAPITESAKPEMDDSYLLPRLLSLPMTIKTRLWHTGVAKGKAAMASVQKLPQKLMDDVKSQCSKVPTMIKGKFDAAYETLKLKKSQFLKTLVQWEVSELRELAETNVVAKKAVEITEKTIAFSLETCEKTFGKEETSNAIAKGKSLLRKIGGYLPASFKEVYDDIAASTKAK